MPVNTSQLANMEREYGPEKGRSYYFAMEKTGSPSFRKGLKTAKREGHTVKNLAAFRGRKRRNGRKRRGSP